MNLPNFSDPLWFFLLIVGFFMIVIGRYLLIAGLFYLVFHKWFFLRFKQRKINNKTYKPGQFKTEFKWSCITSLIFSISGALTVLIWQKGFTKAYSKIDEYGWWYLPVSLVTIMILHETYYYWLHRWMHHPKIFPIVHKIHHDSNITSPFTAFSFHPLEGILQAVFMPMVIFVLPLHYYVIIINLTIMTFSSVINHLDIEIYSSSFLKGPGKWLIGATHHSLHHRQFKYNYGLYFTFWDKLKKTESPLFEQLFEEKTRDNENKK